MKQNKKWILTSGLMGVIFCGASYALDLGEMRVNSMPGEPLNAVIPLIDAPRNLDLLEIDLGTREEFSQAVIGYSDDLGELEFAAYRELNGKIYILVTTDTPLEEEVVHFLLAVKAAHARVIREYVIIEEDDVYVAHAQPAVIQHHFEEDDEDEEEERLPLTKLPLPVIAYPDTEEDDDRELTRESEIQTEIQEEVVVAYEGQYRVREGDSLWRIAKEHVHGQNNANFYKVLAALQQLNPDAFIDNNVNQLRSGVTLTLPTIAQINQMDLRDGTAQVQAQLSNFGKPTAKSAVAQAEVSTPATNPATTAQAEQLRILTPTGETTGEVSATTVATETENAQLRENLALTNESLTEAQRNNEALQERLQSLEKQISTLRELVALREQQAAATENQPGAEASTTGQNTESTPGLGLSNTKNSASELWQKVSANQWAKYLGLSVIGLIILLLLLSSLRSNRRSRRAEVRANEEVREVKGKEKAAEVRHEVSENEDMSIKLELAQAYYDIGDTAGARVLLQEIIRNGSLSQRHAAEALLAKIEMESRQK